MRLSIAASLCLLSASAPAGAVNWPEPGMNAEHTSYNSKETTLTAANVGSLTLKWKFPTNAEIDAPPVQAGKAVFALSRNGNLYAINASTGAELWSYVVDQNGVPANWGVAVAGKLVYTNCQLDYNGGLYGGHSGVCALNAATGALVWSYAIYDDPPNNPVNSAPYNAPIVANGMVFMAEADTASYFHVGYVVALNAATGAQVWGLGNCGDEPTLNSCNYVSAAPFAAEGGYLYYNSGTANGPYGFPGAFCKVAQATGVTAWCHYVTDTDVAPSLGNGRVYFAAGNGYVDNDNTIMALNQSTGAVDWTYSTGGTYSRPDLAPAVANGNVYVTVNSQGSLYALSENKGKSVFTLSNVVSGASIANGVLFAYCSGSAEQCAFDVKSGAQLQSLGTGGATTSAPFVANGVEITVCGNDNVCAYAP